MIEYKKGNTLKVKVFPGNNEVYFIRGKLKDNREKILKILKRKADLAIAYKVFERVKTNKLDKFCKNIKQISKELLVYSIIAEFPKNKELTINQEKLNIIENNFKKREFYNFYVCNLFENKRIVRVLFIGLLS